MSRLAQLVPGPAAGFEQPFDMLEACHERVHRTLALLRRLRDHVDAHGADVQARQAARDVLRYFDIAAPQHHLDEERHVLPALAASGDAQLMALGQQLGADHRAMEAGWARAREALAALADGTLDRLDAERHAALDGFATLYADHIAAEEAAAFPEARTRLDAEAQAAMGQDMRRRRGAG